MIIINLHSIMGNRWAAIARALPGRTDNDIKNHWNTNLAKKLLAMGIDPRTHSHLPDDLHPDFIRLQTDLANFLAKLNSRVTSHSALLSLWPNNAAMTAPHEDSGFGSFNGRDYIVHDGTVDLHELTNISMPCWNVSDPNMMASTRRDVRMSIAEPDAGIIGNLWTVPAPLNEPLAIITESTISSQFGKINNADVGELEDDGDEIWNKLLNY